MTTFLTIFTLDQFFLPIFQKKTASNVVFSDGTWPRSIITLGVKALLRHGILGVNVSDAGLRAEAKGYKLRWLIGSTSPQN